MKQKPAWLLFISLLVLSAAALYLLTIGTVQLPLKAILAVMLNRLLGIESPAITAIQQFIVWNIRWQRIALAVLVGSGLSVSGACFQTMFKNPLADPFILGVSSGAALGAAIAIVTHNSQLMIVLAFAGALMSLTLVYLFSLRGKFIHIDEQLLLAGIACGAMLNAILSTIMVLHSQQMQMILFWLMGSLTNYTDSLIPIAAVVALGLTIAMLYARDLDVMALGDEDARFLGVNIEQVKFILLLSTTMMTGACVSVSGIIGFIGLIVPHMVRKIVGSGHLLLLPLSAIWGAILLLLADGLTRMAPLLAGIPVGVVTALFGSPFFLYILYSAGRRSSR